MKSYKDYENAVQLMLSCLEFVFSKDYPLALKGGTALNFFYYNMPRLSVDIDLTYTKSKDSRKEALSNISSCLSLIKDEIIHIPSVKRVDLLGSENLKLHIIENNMINVKIEINSIIRGSCYREKKKKLSKKVSERFNVDIKAKVLDKRDLFGGKICAALDRQHARDLFDVKSLFDEDGGVEDELRKTFIFYLLSHGRPLDKIIDPILKEDCKKSYDNSFVGMTEQEIPFSSLKETFHKLKKEIHSKLTDSEKEFLISFTKGTPKWFLFPFDIKKKPSIKWRLSQIDKKNDADKKKNAENLEKVFSRL